MRKVIFMFLGQGSQYHGMGKALYQQNACFRDIMNKLDKIPQNILGKSIVDMCYVSHGKNSEFNRLAYTHPALFMVQYSLAKCLMDEGITPDCVIGTSLGESVAIVISGVIEPDKMLEGIIRQALIVERTCEEGMMAAVLAPYSIYLEDKEIFQQNSVIAINFDKHFVIAGLKNSMKDTLKKLQDKKLNTIELPVKYAYHTKYIEPAMNEVTHMQMEYEYQKPQIPILTSLRGDYDYEFNAEYLWKVIREPMFFRNTIRDLNPINEYIFLDLGPSGTLANFVKYNLDAPKHKEIYCIITPYGSETVNYKNIIEKFRNNHSGFREFIK